MQNAIQHWEIEFDFYIMTPSNRNIFHAPAPLCGETADDRCGFHVQMDSNAENVFIWWRFNLSSVIT